NREIATRTVGDHREGVVTREVDRRRLGREVEQQPWHAIRAARLEALCRGNEAASTGPERVVAAKGPGQHEQPIGVGCEPRPRLRTSGDLDTSSRHAPE